MQAGLGQSPSAGRRKMCHRDNHNCTWIPGKDRNAVSWSSGCPHVEGGAREGAS